MKKTVREILSVANPEQYVCKVFGYLVSHSMMLVKAQKGEFPNIDQFYLLFEGVLYFEGPTSWLGVDFDNGSPEECLMLLRTRKGLTEMPEVELLEQFRLFEIMAPDRKVRILANNVYKEKDIPSDFFWLTQTPP